MTSTPRLHQIARRQQVVSLIATGKTRQETADLIGCSVRTVDRYLREPEIKAQLQDERVRLGAEISDAITGGLVRTVAELQRIASDGTDTAKVAASRILLQEGLKWREAAFIEPRLDAIERHLDIAKEEDSA